MRKNELHLLFSMTFPPIIGLLVISFVSFLYQKMNNFVRAVMPYILAMESHSWDCAQTSQFTPLPNVVFRKVLKLSELHFLFL